MDRNSTADHPAKRRRIDAGYNSQDDDGDELFADYEDTVPLSQPFNPAATTQRSPYFSSPAHGPTQPTQILDTPLRERTDPNAIVQVPASSPMHQLPQQVGSPSPAKPRSNVTNPRPALGHLPTNTGSFSDSPADDTSEDELAKPLSRSDIKPSTFVSKAKPRIPPPADSPPSEWQKTLAKFSYTPSDIQSHKRSTDEMANAYSSSAKRPRPLPRQTAPSRAQPVSDMDTDDFTLEHIPDYFIKKKVERMLLVYPEKPVKLLYDALSHKKGNYEDALSYVCELEERQEPKKARETNTIDLTGDESPVKSIKPSTNKSVQSSKSIASKWSTIQANRLAGQNKRAAAVEVPDEDSSAGEPLPKPRRRLVKGRRAAARSPSPEEVAPQGSSTSRQKKTVTSDSDSEAEGFESEVDEQAALNAEKSLLSYINTCSAEELADLAQISVSICEDVLTKRPFKSLEQIRKVEFNPPKLTKAGKIPARHVSTGTKVLSKAETMWSAYQKTDDLISQCEAIGEPIKAAMNKLGIKSTGTSGELSATSLEEIKNDSGIGTPSSSTQADNEDDEVVAKSRSRPIQKPSLMADDLVLMDYQVVGLNWLNILWNSGVSGILADDMGLGKTCQVIAFLSHLKETGQGGLHLAVVPTSTLENWFRESEKFTGKKLRVEPYYGTQRERAAMRAAIMDAKEEIDVIVTTYPTMAVTDDDSRDNKFLRSLEPTVCIFDEGHQLRNSNSNVHKSAARIPAKMRLILSGTPLQNNLQELVSILVFLMPEIFSPYKELLVSMFGAKATTETSSHANLLSVQRTAKARTMMTPFILRRKKPDVGEDNLPKKISRVEYCDMDPRQAKVYADIKAMQREEFRKKKNGQSNSSSSNYMMKLRLTSCHPLLARHWFDDKKIQAMAQDHFETHGDAKKERVLEWLRKMNDFSIMRECEADHELWGKYQLREDLTFASGKIQKTLELVKEFSKNGDRTLFFSQFKLVLDVMEDALSAEGIPFLRFDGGTATKLRQEIIDQFYQDKEIPIFLVSTGSGGSGINITAANKVIINDLSWNPQEDIQAENRAHRVGQLREVEVIRLVTRGTIEEQILALGNSKLALDERVAGAGYVDPSDPKASEKTNKEMKLAVQNLMLQELKEEEELDAPVEKGGKGVAAGADGDLAEQFKSGLEEAGVEVVE